MQIINSKAISSATDYAIYYDGDTKDLIMILFSMYRVIEDVIDSRLYISQKNGMVEDGASDY